MEFEGYLREIASLVETLDPGARLLDDMDLHVAGEWFADGVPLETALAGVRKGAVRLRRLKRPPDGLPLRRLRPDVARERKRRARRSAAAPAAAPPPHAAPEGGRWRAVVRRIAAEVGGAPQTPLEALADERGLGPEQAFVRFAEISREHYRRQLDAMDPARRAAWTLEVGEQDADRLAAMSPEARQKRLSVLVRRRLIAENPVLDPDRFWDEE